MTPKVSIVVPIYGVEKYLRECVDSILAQTLNEIEVILVDDGSPDGCPAIVDEYAAKDPRVVAVHQENGGYGRAVNYGIEVATGEYIGIIESDDWIDPTMYEKLYKKACETDADLVKAEFWIYNSANKPADKVFGSDRQNLTDAPEGAFTLEAWPKIFTYHASIWSNLYRASFVKEIKLVETRSASYQDFPFMCECYCRARRLAVVREPLVHYRMEEDQSSSTIRRDERLLVMPEQCIRGKDILKQYGKFDSAKQEFYSHAFIACMGFYRMIVWSHKRAFLTRLQELFSDLDDLSQNTYLKKREKRIIAHIQAGHLLRSLLTFKDIRRLLFSAKKSSAGFAVTLFGVRFMHGQCKDRPALVTIRI